MKINAEDQRSPYLNFKAYSDELGIIPAEDIIKINKLIESEFGSEINSTFPLIAASMSELLTLMNREFETRVSFFVNTEYFNERIVEYNSGNTDREEESFLYFDMSDLQFEEIDQLLLKIDSKSDLHYNLTNMIAQCQYEL